jgi:transketolase
MKITLENERDLKLMANSIRSDIMEMLVEAKSGHSAGPLGLAEVYTELFFREMNYDPKNTHLEGRDRFVLSNGHVAPVLYATMSRAGFFPKSEIMGLRKLGSKLQGHPSKKWLPGIENSSGPLGQGLSIACGMALAGRLDKKTWRVYCAMSDGEHDEGATWESILFAAKYKLDNLVAIMDRNFIQIDGKTEDIMPLEPLGKKYEAFGWHVISVDGHDFGALRRALSDARGTKGKPTMIIANTVPGKGVSFMEHLYEWHGKPPSKEQAQAALLELANERAKIEARTDAKGNASGGGKEAAAHLDAGARKGAAAKKS